MVYLLRIYHYLGIIHELSESIQFNQQLLGTYTKMGYATLESRLTK